MVSVTSSCAKSHYNEIATTIVTYISKSNGLLTSHTIYISVDSFIHVCCNGALPIPSSRHLCENEFKNRLALWCMAYMNSIKRNMTTMYTGIRHWMLCTYTVVYVVSGLQSEYLCTWSLYRYTRIRTNRSIHSCVTQRSRTML